MKRWWSAGRHLTLIWNERAVVVNTDRECARLVADTQQISVGDISLAFDIPPSKLVHRTAPMQY